MKKKNIFCLFRKSFMNFLRFFFFSFAFKSSYEREYGMGERWRTCQCSRAPVAHFVLNFVLFSSSHALSTE